MLARLAAPGLLALALAGALPSRPSAAQKAVLLVRHAEKVDASKDPALSPAGEERAKALARHLKDAGIAAIVASEYLRTQKTAEPLATQLKLTPTVVSAKKAEDTLALLREKHAGDVVLVVGHSNTVPELLKKLGVTTEVTIGDDEYDNLFVVVPRESGPPTFLRLRYGSSGPSRPPEPSGQAPR